ncbi:MAG: glutamate decarboxylase [Bacillota bacterium]|uniref:Signal transducing protein n=2 Tax=Carboxydocella TaxID=178898 RepID=A0A1T4LAY3_9FIRM|nr:MULTISPECIES: hypothetical protein [Carboxydocella]AVX19875.1 hypothetical protein CFE_0676 [Carboxydocella thermautotrophica]AVX30284.1 hypothetical protein CTH_0681 [Carboxydocella thermautotrophica]SJZ51836.1 hypothetical protein SAMN02745885_00117 [Carboxydocella sporoproducens DSM 16521]GAW28701.1 hypothetical protein ULO1_12710 [Carboxydocella sp. ULO1]GAW30546.1 hypothetical protein JDF658_03110 [Carboxydocella sp. JDF658]
MLKVVYIAPSKTAAEKLRDVLMAEGFLVSLRPVGLASSTQDDRAYEILVPASELEDALEVINNHAVYGR